MSEGGGIRERLRESLTVAMRSRDGAAAAALRSALSALANAEAVEDASGPDGGHFIAGARLGVGAGEAARRDLSESEVIGIMREEITERLKGQADHARRLRLEAEALAAVVTPRP